MEEKSLYKWPWWRYMLTGLSMIAFILSSILSWHYLKGGSMPGCDGVSSCEQVLNSKWSMIGGMVPVSSLAMGVYLVILISSFYIGPDTEAPVRRLAWAVLLILAGSVAGMAIWFTIVQKWMIGEFCPYCMTAHITGILIAAIVIWRTINEHFSVTTQLFISSRLHTVGLIAGGLALAGMLAASQVIFKTQTIYRDGISHDKLPTINYKNAPVIGSHDAPYVVELLFDYQCPHCQKLHFMIDNAISGYHGKLAFALCPTPLNTECNPYIPRDVDAFKNSCELVKIGLAVWVAGREAYAAFDNWMFSFESGDKWHPRSLEAARAKAIELVGQARFDAAWAAPWIGEYLQTCIDIYGQTSQGGKGGVPKLVFGSRWVIPEPGNADELVRILQKSLSVPKP